MADVVDPFCANWTFPFAKLPKEGRTWLQTARRRTFGAYRAADRDHAGVDIIQPVTTPVLAISAGTVLKFQLNFTDKKNFETDALWVDHDTYVVRYGELRPGQSKNGNGKTWKVGDTMEQGQQIGQVGYVARDSQMLHFELYWGDSTGNLSNHTNKIYKYVSGTKYQRRSDLLDPTEYVNLMARNSGF
jgi:murein DD-endopeptidase MepM/ murein hydrolase activator NlpD